VHSYRHTDNIDNFVVCFNHTFLSSLGNICNTKQLFQEYYIRKLKHITMTIVDTQDTRNETWAKDTSNFGYRMLAKMGWSEGKGLGKNETGKANHLRAVRRGNESLGLGAESNQFASTDFSEIRNQYHSVLDNLKETHATAVDQQSTSKNDNKKLVLAQNKVTAGHAKKWRQAKDVSTKSDQDMAAIMGVSVDDYVRLYKKDNTKNKHTKQRNRKSKTDKDDLTKKSKMRADDANQQQQDEETKPQQEQEQPRKKSKRSKSDEQQQEEIITKKSKSSSNRRKE